MNSHSCRRGVVLIAVLGVLVVLALLATTFATIARIERSTARNYLDDSRAKLLAQSGIEYAVARLRGDLQTQALLSPGAVRPMVYWGDVVDEFCGAPPNEGVRLESARNPSYALDAAGIGTPSYNPYQTTNPTPLQIDVDGHLVGVSMTMDSGTYGLHSDVVSLRVTDLQGRININDGLNEPPTHRPVTENLRRILNVLGSLPTLQEPGLGNLIVDHRPPAGYRAIRQILPLLGGDEQRYAKVRRFVTVFAWVDKQVALPVPLSTEMLSEYPVGSEYYRGNPEIFRAGRGLDYKGNTVAVPLKFAPPTTEVDPAVRVWGMDELRPQWVQITERSPVNVNTAPREVLIALIAHLKGFFLLERRRKFGNESFMPGMWTMWGGLGLYNWMITYYTYSPEKYHYRTWWEMWSPDHYEVDEPDEVGRLFVTQPFVVAGGSTVSSGTITAESIADEIIACRQKTSSTTFNYGSAWFGGPFRTWRQFDAFCDNLVSTAVLKDTRPLFRDYPVTGIDPWGWSATTIASTVQQKYAARAMADVLKSNFNPNLHLNELNPDANLHTLVDKTDLVVNSTEFCFTPMGYYEIESLGRVLIPSGPDAFSGPNRMAAAKKVTVVVKAFDVLRHTTQKDFYAGTLAPKTGWQPTNNNLSVETGPEPDNGVAPQECEFDGYVALPTVGGHGTTHPKGALATTPAVSGGNESLGSKMHAHFGWDDRLHHHVDGPAHVENLTRIVASADEGVTNFKDPGASYPGPYMPTSGTPGSHRLARSFRLIPGQTQPSLLPTVDLDLRVDGVYSERHSGLAWRISPDVLPKNPGSNGGYMQNGVAAYWIKPTFVPELSGKTRKFLDLSLGAASICWGESVHEFAHYFFPGHDALPGSVSPNETGVPFYIDKIAPVSFLFGMNWGGGASKSLNHEFHSHNTPIPSVLRQNRWVHVVLSWQRKYNSFWNQDYTVATIYVNGKLVADSSSAPLGHAQAYDVMPGHPDKWWYFQPDGSANSVRLGRPSRIMKDESKAYDRGMQMYAIPPPIPATVNVTNVNANHIQNWSSDATLDEFYFWGLPSDDSVAGALQNALSLWNSGRYYAPQADDAEFESGDLAFSESAPRQLPPPSNAQPPGGEASSGTTATNASSSGTSILGLAWTLRPEGHQANGVPVVYDYGSGTEALPVKLEFRFKVGSNSPTPVVSNDAFSTIGDGLVVPSGQTVRYLARFRIEGAGLNTVLLATPILDDVSIYHTTGLEYLSYVIE